MPRAKTTRLYRSFVKGLITEASPLTFPENASIDELNTVIERRGSRRRRRGFECETSYQAYPIEQFNWTQGVGEIQEFLWKSPAFKNSLEFLCVQTGGTVSFWDASASPLSSGLKPFTINLLPYAAPGRSAMDVANTPVEMTSGKGFLFIVSEAIEPLVIEYLPDTGSITTTPITIRIRDFDGVYDGLGNDEEPSTLSATHEYNLHNQGWQGSVLSSTPISPEYWEPYLGEFVSYSPRVLSGSGPISTFYSKFSRYPGNNKQWWVAKATADDAGPPAVKAGDFLPDVLDKFFTGNNRAPRGHFVVDAFNVDRTAVSGIFGLDKVVTTERPVSACFYSGRVWYANNSSVYFSQVLNGKQSAGNCYQEADPTSEDISDLIATDGGVIPIPESIKILRIIPKGSGVLVFAINGVWLITGNSSGFSALDITVNKVSPIGCQSPRTVVETEKEVMYWSDVGIMAMAQSSGAFGPIEGKFDKLNISESTVQTYYQNIVQTNRKAAKATFDPTSNVVYWMFADGEGLAGKNNYTDMLVFDVTLQAFYPWKVSTASTSVGPYVCGAFTLLSETNKDRSLRPASTVFTAIQKVGSVWSLVFCKPDNKSFTDWQSFDGVGYIYDSYIETGYELLEDIARPKQLTYVTTIFEKSETEYVSDGDDNYEVDSPSSCMFRVKWAWSDSAVSNKWSPEVQAYRIGRQTLVDPLQLDFNSGSAVVVTKHKVRGRGSAIQFRFSSNKAGSDFIILGWSAAVTGNIEV